MSLLRTARTIAVGVRQTVLGRLAAFSCATIACAGIALLVTLPLSSAWAGTVSADTVLFGTVNRQTPPWDPGNPFQGYGLFIDVGIFDTSGAGDLPSSITLTQSGAPTLTVPFFGPDGPNGKEYFRFSPYGGQTGIYNVNVATAANGTVTFLTHDEDNVFQLPFATGLKLSDNSTTPVFSFNPVAGANQYSYLIRASDGTVVFNANNPLGQCFVSTTPSFQVPTGILIPGQSYYFEARAASCDFTSATQPVDQNLWDNRSDTFSALFTPVAVPEPSSLILVSSATPAALVLAWLRRRRLRSVA